MTADYFFSPWLKENCEKVIIVKKSLYAFNFVLSGSAPTPSHVKVVWTLVESLKSFGASRTAASPYFPSSGSSL